MTDQEVQRLVSQIDTLRKQKAFDEALSASEKIIVDNPGWCCGYRKKADVLKSMKKYREAYNVMHILAKLESEEPSDYYELCLWGLSFGSNSEAAEWAKTGIELCEKNEHHYYFQSLHFLSAYAFINLKKFSEALESLSNIEDGYSVYLYGGLGMKTKEELIKSAEQGAMKSKIKIIRFD